MFDDNSLQFQLNNQNTGMKQRNKEEEETEFKFQRCALVVVVALVSVTLNTPVKFAIKAQLKILRPFILHRLRREILFAPRSLSRKMHLFGKAKKSHSDGEIWKIPERLDSRETGTVFAEEG